MRKAFPCNDVIILLWRRVGHAEDKAFENPWNRLIQHAVSVNYSNWLGLSDRETQSGAHYTNVFFPCNSNPLNLHHYISTTGHQFATNLCACHKTRLSCHVQNCVAIIVLECGWEINEILIPIESLPNLWRHITDMSKYHNVGKWSMALKILRFMFKNI